MIEMLIARPNPNQHLLLLPHLHLLDLNPPYPLRELAPLPLLHRAYLEVPDLKHRVIVVCHLVDLPEWASQKCQMVESNVRDHLLPKVSLHLV